MTTKRAYKLQEFVAHASNVNCLKIGRRTSRVLVTGGEDHKVNLWAIGKPNAVLSLSGHTSAVESVSFDSSEVLVAAGAASGTIKLWDLEEAKIIRTLTGHRSNCISVDFHPFGEFFASGSLDTNLKIWDIRRKGCIHTYKGHTRGVNSIRFTPDGRWVVSGGEDSVVKLWDLTAGKLLHDFKCHDGQIQCIDFHPHEFLLATGSADKTVKFWDLETFELIGSAGPEVSGVRSMTFNPDGRTLLCGLYESLKVFSWEPVRCHDAVDVGWSKLLDMNVQEGNYLDAHIIKVVLEYGLWTYRYVVPSYTSTARLEPYSASNINRSSDHSESKSSNNNLPFLIDNSLKASVARLSVSQNSDAVTKESKTISGSQKTSMNSGTRMAAVNAPLNTTAQTGVNLKRSLSRGNGPANLHTISKSDVMPVIVPRTSVRLEPATEFAKENDGESSLTQNIQSKPMDSRRPSSFRDGSVRTNVSIQPEFMDNKSDGQIPDQDLLNVANSVNQLSNNRERIIDVVRTIGNGKLRANLSVGPSTSYQHESNDVRIHKPRDPSSFDMPRGGRTRTLVQNWERRERSPRYEGPNQSDSSDIIPSETSKPYTLLSKLKIVSNFCSNGNYHDLLFSSFKFAFWSCIQCYQQLKGVLVVFSPFPFFNFMEKKRWDFFFCFNVCQFRAILCTNMFFNYVCNVIPFLDQKERALCLWRVKLFLLVMRMPLLIYWNIMSSSLMLLRSRLRKLQVVQQMWGRKDVKGLISALEKMSDHAVSADIVGVLIDKSDIITLDLCTCLLPVLTSLLDSKMDRHLGICMEILLKLVKTFGPLIHSTLSAGPSVGIDIQAEQRLERCNLCFIELEKINRSLLSLTRKGGSIAKSALELNLALQGMDKFMQSNMKNHSLD
ncbi:hypothetical protein HPP92_013994 [Vanilla planifolia]|uniref:Katanin p80 WD40 repeat-containing subunit B1 homolog n=1 Tax=Vanilla planifolia TaxID=51239 RepID=A0A835UUD0_VANPL|nr:hypothetical protein HPP92_013994 [Vanilla planifolia]